MTDDIDFRKTHQAFRPNLIHSVDATYVRLIIQFMPVNLITIHDCFGVDILNVNNLIECANKAINEVGCEVGLERAAISKKQFYSKFILL